MVDAFLWWTGAVTWAWLVLMVALMMAINVIDRYEMRRARGG